MEYQKLKPEICDLMNEYELELQQTSIRRIFYYVDALVQGQLRSSVVSVFVGLSLPADGGLVNSSADFEPHARRWDSRKEEYEAPRCIGCIRA